MMTAVQPWLPPQQAPAPNIPPPPQPGWPNPYAGFHPAQPPSPPYPPYGGTPATRRNNRALKWSFFVSLAATVLCGVIFLAGAGRMVSEPFTILSVEPIGTRSYVDIAATGSLTSVAVAQGPCTLVSPPNGSYLFECPGYVDIDDPITVAYTTIDGRQDVETSSWASGLGSMGPIMIGIFAGGFFGLVTLVLGIIWMSRRGTPAQLQPVYAAPAYPPGYFR